MSNKVSSYCRRKQLDEEIKDLPKKERAKKEKEESQKETEYTRLLRSRITKQDFLPVKVIGRGAFGEVRSHGYSVSSLILIP